MTLRTPAEERAEHHARMVASLVDMARALLRARGETDQTIRIITHAVEQCAETIGAGYFNYVGEHGRAIDDAIYQIVEAA